MNFIRGVKMLPYEEINKILKKNLPSLRYKHTLGVVKSAIELSKRYNVDVNKAKLAALIHDNARVLEEKELIKLANEHNLEIDEISEAQPSLLHASVGSILARKDFGIEDKEILGAIKFHTTGKADMNKLEKVIYLADYIEEGRKFTEVEKIREASNNNLDEAILLALDDSIKYIINRSKLI